MSYLLDVNVLLALIDPTHVSHDAAHVWFARLDESWATCPMTENAVLRIAGHPKYANSPGSPAAVVPVVARLRHLPLHVFWHDDLDIMTSSLVDAAQMMTSGQVTDTYLLALAVLHGGRLATFDRRLSTKAVRGGRAGLCVIGG